MKRIVSVIAIVAVVLVVACKKKEMFQPSRLFGTTYSGQSLQTVERELKLRGGDWNVLEDQRSLSGGSEPPSRLYVISKPGFREYGSSGELVLTFFNDELVSTKFYPTNLSGTCTAVEQEQQIALCDAGEARIEPATRVWVGKDQSGRPYVGWIDKQRQSVIDNWNAAHKKE